MKYLNFYEKVFNKTCGIKTETKAWRTAATIDEVPLEFGIEATYEYTDESTRSINGQYSFECCYYEAELGRFVVDSRHKYLDSSVFDVTEMHITVEQAKELFGEYYSGYQYEESYVGGT